MNRFLSGVMGQCFLKVLTGSVLALSVFGMTQAAPVGPMKNIQAERMMQTAESMAKDRQVQICIAIVDAAGRLMAFKRMDDAIPGCVDAAIQKARAAALYQETTQSFMQRASNAETAVMQLPDMLPVTGGVPVSFNNEIIGAVGISGTTASIEAAIAKAAGSAR